MLSELEGAGKRGLSLALALALSSTTDTAMLLTLDMDSVWTAWLLSFLMALVEECN